MATQKGERIRWELSALVVLCLFSAADLSATTLARLSLEQLAAAASAIVRVRCVSVRQGWEGGEIWTTTNFSVLETFKGPAHTRVSVRLPGGHAGHLIASVEGVPRFAAGEEAILFLERSGAEFTVSGWVEGTFRIARDARSGEEYVTQDSSAFAVFDSRTRAFHTEGVRHLPMARFREMLRAAIAGDAVREEDGR